jgi:hypothetical protein
MLELTTGTIATGVGMASVGTADAAEVVTKEVAGVDTTAQAEIKNNEAAITESEKSVGIETDIEVASTSNNTEAESPVSPEEPTINALETTAKPEISAVKIDEAAPQVQPKANTTNAAAPVQKVNADETQDNKAQDNVKA